VESWPEVGCLGWSNSRLFVTQLPGSSDYWVKLTMDVIGR